MLPSLANEDHLSDALAADGVYFGSRPDVWSWAALYRAAVPPPRVRRQVDPPDHRLILKYILKQTLDELDGRGASVPKGVRRSGFVDLLSSSIRELLLEDISPDLLLAETPAEDGDAKPRDLLYRLYSDYLIHLEENGLADNAQLPILTREACAEDCGKLSGRPMFWIGFLSFTGAQLKLIRMLARRGVRMEFFSPDAALEGFYDASAQLGMERRDICDRGGKIVSLTARDAYGQFDALARGISLARVGSGGLYEAVGTGDAPDAWLDVGILADINDHPLLASALETRGVPCESRAERAVSDTLPVRIARQAWDAYMLDWPARRTLHLLSQPVFGLSLDRDRVARRSPEGWRAWRALAEGIPGAGAVLDRLKKFCDTLSDLGGHTGEELLEALLAAAGDDEWEARLSAEAGDDTSLDYALREVSSARLEIKQKLELLRELKPAIGVAGDVRFVGGDALLFLLNWSREATTALPPRRVGTVKLYDSPPPVLASHRVWIMTDVTPSRYGGAVSEGSLLGAEVRDSVNAASETLDTAVHLPTLSEKREQREALFRRLAAVGDDVTIMARPAHDSQGRPQDESPFLASLLADRAARWIRAGEIIDEGDGALTDERVIPQLLRGTFPRTGLLRRGGDGAKARVRLSALDAWRDCPFLYWCGLMRLEPPRDMTSPVDQQDRGSLLHELWQRVWEKREPGDKKPVAVNAAEEWDALIEEKRRAGEAIGASKSSAVAANLRRLVLRLARRMDETEAAAEQLGLTREGVLLEYELPVYEGKNAVFVGRADRVDLWREVGAVLLDYKLGISDNYKNSRQLAAYAFLMREADAPRVEGFGFMGHKDARARGSWSDAVFPLYGSGKRNRNDMSPDAATDAAGETIAALDEQIGAGFFPAMYESARCKRCGFSAICRRAERRGMLREDDEDEFGDPE